MVEDKTAQEGPRRRRILVADDDEATLSALEMILTERGYDVCALCDGVSLLDELAASIIFGTDGVRKAPDVIVTDVRMPGFGALNIVEGARDLGWSGPVIVMSAFTDVEVSERVKRLGGARFVAKPFDPETLVTAIEAACEANVTSSVAS